MRASNTYNQLKVHSSFTTEKGNVTCNLCQKQLLGKRLCNMKRHLESLHPEYFVAECCFGNEDYDKPNKIMKYENITGDFEDEDETIVTGELLELSDCKESHSSSDENESFLERVNVNKKHKRRPEDPEITYFTKLLIHKLQKVKKEHLEDLQMDILNYTHEKIKELK